MTPTPDEVLAELRPHREALRSGEYIMLNGGLHRDVFCKAYDALAALQERARELGAWIAQADHLPWCDWDEYAPKRERRCTCNKPKPEADR